MKGNSKVGVAWRPELSQFIAEESTIAFSEVLADNYWTLKHLPTPIAQLRDSGTTIVPHAVSLSLGGARRPDDRRLDLLANLAQQLDAPFVSEHFAFVRAAGLESGHLLPFQRNEQMLELVIENVHYAQARLPKPLCLENIATLFDWPEQQISEAEFIASIVRETGIGILLDVSNLYANSVNLGWSIDEYLDALPLDRITYVHIAGGTLIGNLYHDTHAHPLQAGPLEVLRKLSKRITLPAVLLEQDDNFQSIESVRQEIHMITKVVEEQYRLSSSSSSCEESRLGKSLAACEESRLG